MSIKGIFIGLWVVLVFVVSSCDNPEENTPENNELKGTVLSLGSCKAGKDGDPNERMQGCLVYDYNPETQILLLTHINAAFNCCPEQVNVQFSFFGDTITLTESEVEPMCDCNCRYDLQLQIENLASNFWYLRVYEPLLNYDTNDTLMGYMNLEANPSGSFCVLRSGYPWME